MGGDATLAVGTAATDGFGACGAFLVVVDIDVVALVAGSECEALVLVAFVSAAGFVEDGAASPAAVTDAVTGSGAFRVAIGFMEIAAAVAIDGSVVAVTVARAAAVATSVDACTVRIGCGAVGGCFGFTLLRRRRTRFASTSSPPHRGKASRNLRTSTMDRRVYFSMGVIQ